MTGPGRPATAPIPPEPGASAAAAYRAGIFDPTLLSACISCGFCLPVCPTYAQTKLENSSPRGRITLMRALEEGRLDEDDPTLQHQAGLCLGCRACETVCPAGVKYGELLEQWRDHQWRGRHTPPIAGALRAGVRVTPALAAGGLLRGAARTTGAPEPDRPHLMLGCLERSLYPKVSRAALRLIPDADVPEGQGCCGALHAHNGGSREAAEMAQRLGERMPGTIVSTSGGCAAYLAHQLGHDRVKEVGEFLLAAGTRTPRVCRRCARSSSTVVRRGWGSRTRASCATVSASSRSPGRWSVGWPRSSSCPRPGCAAVAPEHIRCSSRKCPARSSTRR